MCVYIYVHLCNTVQHYKIVHPLGYMTYTMQHIKKKKFSSVRERLGRNNLMILFKCLDVC